MLDSCLDSRRARRYFTWLRPSLPGTSELVYACSRVVHDLDKCATAVRGATMANIVPGSLKN